MEKLYQAIGCPPELAICSHARKGIDQVIEQVYKYAEHRECMHHLVTNFKKKFHGKVFDQHLWVAAYSWNLDDFKGHMAVMEDSKPEAIAYLKKYHNRLWSRSKFSTSSKVDYVTNNLAECFNNWINKHKGLMLVELVDKIRRKIMVKFDKRRKIAMKLQGHRILPSVMKELHEKSRGLDLEHERSGDTMGEVTENGTGGKRHIVELNSRTCTCREWQVLGKPCNHAIMFIGSIRGIRPESYVDDCYTVAKFTSAYAPLILALTGMSQWPKKSHGFFLYPPILRRSAGRRKTERYKGSHEDKGISGKRRKGQHQCPICKGYGHRWQNCKEGDPEAVAYAIVANESNPNMSNTMKSTSSKTTSTKSVRSMSGFNQLEVASMELVDNVEQFTSPTKQNGKDEAIIVAPDSPAMSTRSKKKLEM